MFSVETELIFTKDALIIRAPVKVPIIGDSMHEDQISYDLLPQSGINMTITEINRKVDDLGQLTAVVFKVSAFQLLNSQIQTKVSGPIEIALTQTAMDYNLIPLNKYNRNRFPPYKVPFDLVTNVGIISCHVSGGSKNIQQGDPEGGNYIVTGLKPWFEKNKPKVDEKVYIEVIEPGKKYKLEASGAKNEE